MINNVEYDLDTSGGLMPQIQLLIAPPVSEERPRRREPRHPYYRRPGKGHNHDSCDACGEGGDLLCCDRCPASFHLLCHDPPLDEDDIPLGMWLCHSCKANGVTAKVEQAVVNKVAEQPPTMPPTAPAIVENSIDPSDTRATRLARRRETSEAEKPSKTGASPVLRSLQTLISAAEHMNPRQFELPYELTQPIPFPGTDKVPTKVRRSTLRKKPYELDNGLVPLPARLCHECRRSCRRAPLLACDYCPLLFHQDCLDPPLTSLPSGRWMCPAHPQHLVDQKLLQSFGASERLKLWDRFCQAPVDQETVKLDFLRQSRVSRYYPKLRPPRVKLPPANTVRVPDAVRHHYQHPAQLMPLPGHPMPSMPQHSSLSTAEEQEQWLSSVVALQSSIAEHLSSQTPRQGKLSNGGLSNGDIFKEETKPRQPQPSTKMPPSKLATLLQAGNETDTSDLELELERLDEKLVRTLALQRLRELSNLHQVPRSLSPRAGVVRARAVLYPLLLQQPGEEAVAGAGHPMPYRTLSVGLGADMDVSLASYGHCNFVSAKHAAIFFDESCQQYELINYSEFGTAVDNVVYSCDLTERRPAAAVTTLPRCSREPTLAEGARLMLDAARRKWQCVGRAVQNEEGGPPEQHLKELVVQQLPEQRMSSVSLKIQQPCGCDSKGPAFLRGQLAGWEGTALLNHGSYLRFGCLQFVFSVTQSASPHLNDS